MTTLVLGAADAALGSLAGAATSLVSGTLSRAVSGALGGGAKGSVRVTEGPRLAEMGGLTSTEGAPIPRLYGRARLGGQLIWATRFEEIATTSVSRSPRSGGKSLGGASKAAATTVSTTYAYYANLAVGLCEGPVAHLRRVWADGAELDLTGLAMRVHPGTEDQPADPLIVAKEGGDQAPAYRGLAYVVFERLALAPFGNRVPQLSFEVVRPANGVNGLIRQVCLIPGSTEFGYDTLPVQRVLGLGASAPENAHQLQRATDILASLDQLQAFCPNIRGVSLVLTWFGDDLRAGSCTIAPRVDLVGKATSGAGWSVGGLPRAYARQVSFADGRAAYGGTPSDDGVLRLIRELKTRELKVTLYPFVAMDIAAGNGLPDPRRVGSEQPAYPWRGRITCDPAPDAPGTADGSAAASAQIAALFGVAAPGHFGVFGETVLYGGPPEWSLRRLVLHYACLGGIAGGVDAVVIGSELVGLTRVRGEGGEYPAVAALKALAADVKAVVGPATAVTYAADWTEYGAHVPAPGELRFPLDPLWSDPNVAAVSIDYYPPITDWRDGPVNADAALARGPTDPAYLVARLGAGEAFDWYYASDADRLAQVRTPITDGGYGKPWAYRAKDLVGWWSNAHVERAGGVETGATGWVPGSKPIWLNEVGIPAVDKGGNGPNVFPDPKSAESASPPFSRGTRDDLVQLRGLQAVATRFDPEAPGHDPAWNPPAPAYGGRMVDRDRTAIWCWDARPFPVFPAYEDIWSDGANWQLGHWITGRLEGTSLDRLVGAVLADYGLEDGGPIALDGYLDGYVIDRPMSARDALEPLATLFGFDAAVSGGGVRWRGRGGRVDAAIGRDDLVDAEGEPLTRRGRDQESELPAAIEIGFADGEADYARAAVGSRRLAGSSRREIRADVAAVTHRGEAQRLADAQLQDAWASRESVSFALSPRAVALEPGDLVSLAADDTAGLFRVEGITDGAVRRVTARAAEPAIFETGGASVPPRRRPSAPSLAGSPDAIVLTLAVAATDPAPLQYAAVAAEPWPGQVAVWRSRDGASFELGAMIDLPAVIGTTLSAFPAGPVWRWDRVAHLDVKLSADAFSSIDDLAALGGGNRFAVEGPDGVWEIVQAASAELIGTRTVRLSRLLRGLGESEDAAGRPVPAGARFVKLDDAVVPLTAATADLGTRWTYRIGPAARDYADPSYRQVDATVAGDALKPASPVHVSARRGPDGVTLSWTRRTRRDGDAWEPVEVPLGEDREAYEVDILAGGSVVRTLPATVPSALYAAEFETADLGGPQTGLTVRVVQLGAAVGRGYATTVTVPVMPG